MKAVYNGTTLAESDQTIVIDGVRFFRPDDIQVSFDKTGEDRDDNGAYERLSYNGSEIAKRYTSPDSSAMEKAHSANGIGDFTNWVSFTSDVEVS